MKASVLAWPVACVMFLLTLPAFAGVVYEVEVLEAGSEAPVVTLTKTDGNNLRLGMKTKKGKLASELIFRPEQGEMITIDHDNRSYVVIDQATMDSLAAQLGDAQAQIDEAMKNVPQAQRAMIEKMMKKRLPAASASPARVPSTLERIGTKKAVSGFDSVLYEVHKDGQKVRELWVTEWDQVAGGDELASAYRQMAVFYKELMDALAKMSAFGGGIDLSDPGFEHFAALGGLPVLTRHFNAKSGSVESEATVLSSRQVDLPADVFAPPSDYERMDLDQGRR